MCKGEKERVLLWGGGFCAIGYAAELCVSTRHRWVNDWIGLLGLLKKGEYFELFHLIGVINGC